MKFSLYVNPQTSGPDDDRYVIQSVTDQIRFADANEFAGLYLTEHHVTGYNAYADPLLFGAYVRQYVQNMTLGFSVAVLPFHHPLRFATQCNVLDNLYDGRFTAGIGIGGGPIEYAAFGLPLDDRRTLMNENIEAVLGCWRGDYTHTGTYWNFTVERIVPSPYTKPHPKVARACTSDDSIVDTGHRGWQLLVGRFPPEKLARQIALYRDALESGGHDAAEQKDLLNWITNLKLVYVADSDEQAIEELRPYLARYLIQSAKANSADFIVESQAEELMDDFIARAVLAGSPETVARRIQEYADVGISNMMIWTAFGSQPHEMVMGSMRKFVDKVMPRFSAVAVS